VEKVFYRVAVVFRRLFSVSARELLFVVVPPKKVVIVADKLYKNRNFCKVKLRYKEKIVAYT